MKKLSLIILCFASITHSQNNTFTLTSSAFNNNASIPSKYTCDGNNISPALQWKNPPAGTQSFALIVDDPDAPKKTWVHWVVFNIPSSVTNLPEGVANGSFKTGVNDFYYMKDGSWQYGGPCPPSGQHRYYFTLYALDTMLTLPKDPTKKDLVAAMKGHILGQATLIGLYERKK